LGILGKLKNTATMSLQSHSASTDEYSQKESIAETHIEATSTQQRRSNVRYFAGLRLSVLSTRT